MSDICSNTYVIGLDTLTYSSMSWPRTDLLWIYGLADGISLTSDEGSVDGIVRSDREGVSVRREKRHLDKTSYSFSIQ